MRLIVLYGSRACEHDVSIITAVQAMDNADPSKYTVIPVYIDMAGRWWTGTLHGKRVCMMQIFIPILTSAASRNANWCPRRAAARC